MWEQACTWLNIMKIIMICLLSLIITRRSLRELKWILLTHAPAQSRYCVHNLELRHLLYQSVRYIHLTQSVTPTQSFYGSVLLQRYRLMMTRFLKLQSHFLFSETFSALDTSLQSYGCEIYKMINMASLSSRERTCSYLYLTVTEESNVHAIVF